MSQFTHEFREKIIISGNIKAPCYPLGKAEKIHKEGKGEDKHWGSDLGWGSVNNLNGNISECKEE